jgi:hypothetical protein
MIMGAVSTLKKHGFKTCYAIPLAATSRWNDTPAGSFVLVLAPSVAEGRTTELRVTIWQWLSGVNPKQPTEEMMHLIGRALAQLHSIQLQEFPSMPLFAMGFIQAQPFLDTEVVRPLLYILYLLSLISTI